MITDGYAHCGISKYLPVADVLTVMRNVGVDRAVLCQHLGEYDNSYLADVVGLHRRKFAAVCLVNPASPHPVEDLQAWHATARFRGVRLLAEWLDQHETLWAAAVQLGMALVIYSSQGTAAAASSIAAFVGKYPTARIVMTHLGNPSVQDGQLVETELLTLARFPGVFVQLSGLSQFCEFPHAPLGRFIQEIIGKFGVERIYWGSNYPVCGSESEYRRDLLLVQNGGWGLTPEQVRAVTSGTAAKLWFDGVDNSPRGESPVKPARW